MDIKPILSDIQLVVSLYGEILLCILAAAVLGFVVGKMISRSTYRKNMHSTVSMWKSRYANLEDSARRDTDALEDQLHTLGRESKDLQVNHTALKKSLTRNDQSVQQARAETIELNRQQAETHARLQRVIQQKDLEIIRLGSRLGGQTSSASSATHENNTGQPGLDNDIDELADSELNHADTVAILPAQNDLDETVQMTLDARTLQTLRRATGNDDTEEATAGQAISEQRDTEKLDSKTASSIAATQGSTAEHATHPLEDGTVVLDTKAAAFARRLRKNDDDDDKISDKDN